QESPRRARRNPCSYGLPPAARGSQRVIWLETRHRRPENPPQIMHYHALVPLIAAVANAIICALVLRGGMRNPVSRVFAWMTLTFISWNLDIFSIYYFADARSALWWCMVFWIGICVSSTAVFHTVCT